MGFMRKCAALCVLGGALIAAPAPSQPPAAPRPPKLVVILVVDQMRSDYIDKYGSQWTGGLRRLLDRGAWFREAAYPYMNTVTCTGHATIATGTFPATHGIVLNAWWDRTAGRLKDCTDDPEARPVGYGAASRKGDDARQLLVPNFADELRSQLGATSRVVSFSMKPRSAIMLAGHRATGATWFDASTGAWATSSAYSRAPVRFIVDFLKAHPVAGDFGKSWIHAIPESAYLFADDAPGEKAPGDWGRTFPHLLKGSGQTPDPRFYGLWEASPFSDAYLGEMAQAAVDALGLGKDRGTDFLGVSFSALDLVGHDFGPRSQEAQDVLARLDQTIGALLTHLDRVVGEGNYVVALSADHGVAPIPEQITGEGFDAGRIVVEEVAQRAEKALEARLGPEKHVARMVYTDLYFGPGVFEKLAADAGAMQAVRNAILEVPGVSRVLRADELRRGDAMSDPVARAAALSYYPGRSGDLIVVPKPYWFFVNASRETPPGPAATHGTLYGYDQRVPLILFGQGIEHGVYLQPATPADIAPTLALLCGITLARPDGRVLAEALSAVSR